MTGGVFLARLWLARRGAVRFRRCFDPDLVRAIARGAERIYAEREAALAQGRLPPEWEKLAYLRRTIPLDAIAVEGARASELLACKVIHDLARAYLGRKPSRDPNSYIRSLIPGPDIQSLPFHQDQTILQMPLLNVWIPLSPCGVAAPGLEVVRTSQRKLLAVAGVQDDPIPVERARIDERLVLAEFGARALWHPSFEPGDALLFAGTTVHRTYVTPRMTEPRLSVELRFV